LQYGQYPNVFIAFNDDRARKDFYHLTRYERPVLLLPNYYVRELCKRWINSDVLNVACLGALRPLKNQLIQAIGAIKCADRLHRVLHFHVNSDRIEMFGDSVLKNLRALFTAHRCQHVLVEHPWMEHEKMLEFVSGMDLGMQVSLSETFNIMAADFVCSRVPIVVSDEIPWASRLSVALPSDSQDIADKMVCALRWPWINVFHNYTKLTRYCRSSRRQWFKSLHDTV
jgi:hypothetical protein